MKDVLDLEIRRTIHNLLLRNPGLNLTDIAEILNVSIPLAKYHLEYMEKHEVISTKKQEGFRRYYIKGKIGVDTKYKLSVFRQEIPLQITIFLLKHPYSSHKKILEQFAIAPSTLSSHLKKLVAHDIISEKHLGEKRGYVVVNEKEIIALLIRYKPSRVLRRFKDTWSDFSI
jgi:predicted transcriptional regulator